MKNNNFETERDWEEAFKQNGEQAVRRAEYTDGRFEELERRQAEREQKEREAWLALSEEERKEIEERRRASRMW